MAVLEVMAPLTYIPTSLAIMSPYISIPLLAVIELVTFIPMPEVSDVAMILLACMPTILPFISPATDMPVPELDMTLPAYMPTILPFMSPATDIPMSEELVIPDPTRIPTPVDVMLLPTSIPTPLLTMLSLTCIATLELVTLSTYMP